MTGVERDGVRSVTAYEGTGAGAPPLCRDGLDRLACRRRDEAWLERAWSRARVLPIVDGRIPVAPDGTTLRLFGPAEVPGDAERYFLGVDSDGVPYFAVDLPSRDLPPVPPAGSPLACARFVNLREVGACLSTVEASLATTAVGLHHWHARHAYSPHTGRPTRSGEAGWVRVAGPDTPTGAAEPGLAGDAAQPDSAGDAAQSDSAGDAAEPGSPGGDTQPVNPGGDAETMWPRTDPAVIVLVHDGTPGERGGRCLLATNVNWSTSGGLRRYSCLAGFVEPGESAEQAIVREISEEVGVTVTDPRYVTSQPWPFPGSLMLGFSAQADPNAELKLDPEEILDARWFTHAEVKAALAGVSPDLAVPLGISIAAHMLARWAAGAIPETCHPC